jgi:hypothetical protein
MFWSFRKYFFFGTAATSSKRSALLADVAPPGIAAARRAIGMTTEPIPVEATPLVAIPVDRELTSAGARVGLAGSVRPVRPVCDADEMLDVAAAELHQLPHPFRPVSASCEQEGTGFFG